MDINVKLTLEASPEIAALLKQLLNMAANPAQPVAEAETPKRRRAAAAAPETPAAPASPAPAAAPAPAAMTKAQLALLITESMQKVGTAPVKAVFTKFGYPTVSDIPAERYSEFAAALRETTSVMG